MFSISPGGKLQWGVPNFCKCPPSSPSAHTPLLSGRGTAPARPPHHSPLTVNFFQIPPAFTSDPYFKTQLRCAFFPGALTDPRPGGSKSTTWQSTNLHLPAEGHLLGRGSGSTPTCTVFRAQDPHAFTQTFRKCRLRAIHTKRVMRGCYELGLLPPPPCQTHMLKPLMPNVTILGDRVYL